MSQRFVRLARIGGEIVGLHHLAPLVDDELEIAEQQGSAEAAFGEQGPRELGWLFEEQRHQALARERRRRRLPEPVVACYGDQLECRDSEIDLDGCDSELESLGNCLGSSVSGSGSTNGPGGGPGGNVCDRAVDICGVSSEDGTPECSGAFECQSSCVVDTGTCDGSDDDLVSCVSDCGGSSGD